MAEPYSRLVVDATGEIVMTCHLDFAHQYQDPAFTQDGCANADMLRDEYEAAIAAAVDQPIATAPGSSTVTPDAGTLADQPAAFEAGQLLRDKAVYQLAQSKLLDSAFISALQGRIDDIDAQLAAGGLL